MINFRKVAWNKLNCSHQDLIDLLKETYEQGRKDLLEEQLTIFNSKDVYEYATDKSLTIQRQTGRDEGISWMQNKLGIGVG